MVEALRPLVRHLAEVCQFQVSAWVAGREPSVRDLREALPGMMAVYVQTAALLAADFYNGVNPESGFFATGVDEIADERLDATAAWVYAGPQSPENRVMMAAHGMVFDAARNTIYRNAEREGVAVARVELSDACHDCASRATVVPLSRRSRSDGVAARFHPGCEGMLVPVRSGTWEPPGYTVRWRERIDAAKRAGNTDPDSVANWISAHYPAN